MAEQDLRDAAKFYRECASNELAQALLAEFEHSMNLLLQHPKLGSPWRGGIRRRYLMKLFPYSIIYTVSREELFVLAIAHHSRRPTYWRGRK